MITRSLAVAKDIILGAHAPLGKTSAVLEQRMLYFK